MEENKLILDDINYINDNIEVNDMGKGNDEPEEEDSNGNE